MKHAQKKAAPEALLKNVIVKGTVILTAAGVISRVIGFFYRIFLTRLIGAEGMGLFQIITPVAGIVFAICSAGIQTAISKFCAEKKSGGSWLLAGLAVSLPVSCLISALIWFNSDYIAVRFIFNEACSPLLKIMAFTFPFSSFHNCVNGYYFGKKKSSVPAFSQLLEQLVRFAAVFIYARIAAANNEEVTVLCAIYSNFWGEIASTLYCSLMLAFSRRKARAFAVPKHSQTQKYGYFHNQEKQDGVRQFAQKVVNIIKFSLPLTANRVLMHLFQSAEAILVPAQLIVYGFEKSDALSLYGILTGMAYPLILFPTAVTNALSVMLLPSVSADHAERNDSHIRSTMDKCLFFCLSMGIMSTLLFIFYGAPLGAILFDQPEVHDFVLVLAWLCPFLYLASTLGSILNGLGKTASTCLQNIAAVGVRLVFLIALVPKFGISMYLAGLLISQIMVCLCHYIKLSRMLHLKMNAYGWLVLPSVYSAISTGCSLLLSELLIKVPVLPDFWRLTICAAAACAVYALLSVRPYRNKLR